MRCRSGAEHTAGALRASGDELAAFLHNIAVDGGIGNPGHLQIPEYILLQPEGHGLGGGLLFVKRIAAIL